LAITARSYDPDIPLARIIELSTVLVASDAFVEAIQRCDLVGTVMTTVDVVQDQGDVLERGDRPHQGERA
jgi:hypothetical protein